MGLQGHACLQVYAQGYKGACTGVCRGLQGYALGYKGACTGTCTGVCRGMQGCAAGVRMQQESVCKAANAGGGVCFPPQSRESLRWEEEEPLRLHTAKILNQFKLRY